MAQIYRVQHIGSLIRPKSLIDLTKPLRTFLDWNEDGTPEQMEEIKQLTEECIRDVVKEQVARSIKPITSGEFERVAYVRGLFENLAGIERHLVSVDSDAWRPNQPFVIFAKAMGLKEREAMIAVSKIRRGARSPYLEEWRFLRSCLSEDNWRHAKITVLTPTWWLQTLYEPYTKDSGYQTDEEYLSDVVIALRDEIMDMYNEGLRNVQVDDPILAWTFLPLLKRNDKGTGRLLDLCIKAHAQLTHDLPSDLNIGQHMCRGNIPGDPEWLVIPGGYEDLAARLFKETYYKEFCVEHISSDKHGDLSFLKSLGRNQVIVLGLVSTKFEELEDLQELKARVMEAANVIGNEQGRPVDDVLQRNIAVSPQCGFSSGIDISAMTADQQWEKLKLLQELADETWQVRGTS